MCCQALEIDEPELKKPAFSLCPHCTGSGCGIYEWRPQMCRNWYCAWRYIGSLPDRVRPDRAHVVFFVYAETSPQSLFTCVYIVGRSDAGPAAFEAPDIQAMLAMFATGPIPVFLSWDETMSIVYPSPGITAEILRLLAVPEAALTAEASEWLANYAPYARKFVGDAARLPAGY